MNNIQVSLKADNQNGIRSIQGVDLFSIIDTDPNDGIVNEFQPLFKEIKQEDIHVK